MKTIVSVAIALLFLAACSPGPEAEVHRVIIHSEAPELTLNLGERWQTDDYTDLGIRIIQETAWQHDGRTLDAYNSLGRNLEEVILQVFKNSTMRGEANDMLHVFLMPVAQDVKMLERKDLKEARAAHERICLRLTLYEHYFK